MPQYLFLLQSKTELDYAPEALKHRLDAYREWLTTVQAHYVDDKRLKPLGRRVVSKKKVYTDGPFVEAYEIIAGYLILEAENLDTAAALAQTCPLLEWFEIHVRPIIGAAAQ